MKVYYNEVEPFLCEWLRRLCHARLIPPGDVDCRDIAEVQSEDLNGYDQCHFFSGIGLWANALELAGWPAGWPVWTGSCPCQPFSIAGKMQGTADKRHLWPEFLRLIAKRHPPAIFGEQVASPLGRKWLAGVRADLEGVGYACGAADLCSAGVGAPHIRQRIYWVANSDGGNSGTEGLQRSREYRQFAQNGRGAEGLANARHNDGAARRARCEQQGASSIGERPASSCDTAQGLAYPGHEQTRRPATARQAEGGRPFGDAAGCCACAQWNGPTTIIECRDGFRRISVQPALFPLVNGDKGRMRRLRAYGNAISPILAAKFIEAAMSCRP